jgi:hypothetical protein
MDGPAAREELTLKKFNQILLEVMVALALGIFLGILFIEWFAGCGETYIAADGNRYPFECVFIK